VIPCRQNTRKMQKIKPALVLLSLLALTQTLTSSCHCQENENVLSVGKYARERSRVEIKPVLPVTLNYLTREEILARRTKEINKYPRLMQTRYTPFHPIWGAIEDGKPWWGLAGAAVFDSGDQSARGMSEESRFIMNPYLLVAANPASTGVWNRSAFTEKEINDPTFPYFWLPESIFIDPVKSLGGVTYNITEYQNKILASGRLKAPAKIKRFSLVAYNARDLGYKYIWFNEEKSINVTNENPVSEPVFIKQMLHCGGTCGCSTTCCNNMSPFMREIDRLRLTRTPARAVVYLWKEEPEDVRATPDLTFLLEFL
jgi:hypothetical protein